MIYLAEDTDSLIIQKFPSEIHYKRMQYFLNETSGAEIATKYISMPIGLDIFKPALEVVRNKKNANIADAVVTVLSTLQKQIMTLQQPNIESFYLPQLYAHSVDDGSVLLEWVLPDFRIGFNIEPEMSESSWYLVSNDKMGAINASGLLARDYRKAIAWVLHFMVANL
jgi:hypothetical protein